MPSCREIQSCPASDHTTPSSIPHPLFHSDELMTKTIHEKGTILIILLVFLDNVNIIKVSIRKWDITLDYSGRPDVMIKALLRGSEEIRGKRRCYTADSEYAGRGHEPRNGEGLEGLKKIREHSLLDPPE